MEVRERTLHHPLINHAEDLAGLDASAGGGAAVLQFLELCIHGLAELPKLLADAPEHRKDTDEASGGAERARSQPLPCYLGGHREPEGRLRIERAVEIEEHRPDRDRVEIDSCDARWQVRHRKSSSNARRRSASRTKSSRHQIARNRTPVTPAAARRHGWARTVATVGRELTAAA